MDWTEKLRNPKQPGDELYLYLLCRMYRRHALVHLKHYWWCTMQHTLPGDLNEIRDKCHLELVFVREWVFGEVKQIRKPKTSPVLKSKQLDTPDTTNIDNSHPPQQDICAKTMPSKVCVVITENASTTTTATQKECKVRLEKLQSKTSSFTTAANTNMAYNMRTRPPKSATSHRTSDRPRPKVDYSRFMVGDEDDTSPPRKRHTVDLKRKPSNSRIASQNYSTKPPTTP